MAYIVHVASRHLPGEAGADAGLASNGVVLRCGVLLRSSGIVVLVDPPVGAKQRVCPHRPASADGRGYAARGHTRGGIDGIGARVDRRTPRTAPVYALPRAEVGMDMSRHGKGRQVGPTLLARG